MEKVLNKEQIQEMGLELLKAFTEAGNTIITNKEGMKELKSMDQVEEYKKMVEEMKFKFTIMKNKKVKKPHHKYPSNYTPSPKRHRKK